MQIPLLSILAIVAYAGAAVLLYQGMLKSNTTWRSYSLLSLLIGLACHGGILGTYWLGSGSIDVSVLHILSACGWLMVAFLLFSRLFNQSLMDSGLIAFPLTALIILSDYLAPQAAVPLDSMTSGTRLHVVSSIAAFAFLGIAAVYALFVSMLDRYLRRNQMTAIVQALPALDVLESLLMRLVLVGFTLLSVVLVSGFIFVDDLLAQHLVHKTVLSIVAWSLYGVLLFGRWRFGWRGRTAVRLTLVATVVLLVSYFGTKLVLEHLLDRSWQV